MMELLEVADEGRWRGDDGVCGRPAAAYGAGSGGASESVLGRCEAVWFDVSYVVMLNRDGGCTQSSVGAGGATILGCCEGWESGGCDLCPVVVVVVIVEAAPIDFRFVAFSFEGTCNCCCWWW